jgi:hypothetical protein
MGNWTDDPALGFACAAEFSAEILATEALVMEISREMGSPVDGRTASRILFDLLAVRPVIRRQSAFGLVVYG